MQKQKLFVFIAVCLISAIFAACGGEADADAKNTDNANDNAEENVEEAKEEIRENLPEANFDGYEFRVLVEEIHPSYTMDIDITELTGERVNDAIYMRDLSIEERFGVKISYKVVTGEGQGTNSAYNSIAAGDNAFDVMKLTPRSASKLYPANITANWDEIPWIDLDRPWWNQNIRNQLSIGSRTVWMSSDASINDYAMIRGLIFNKDLFEAMALEYPYQLVWDGKWTMAAMEEYMKTMPQDLNGDGQYTVDEDRYGIIMASGVIDELTFTWGSQIISKDENNMPYLNLYNPRTIDIIAKVHEWVYDRQYMFAKSNWSDRPAWFESFQSGRTMFMFDVLGQMILLRDSDVNFGILPFPKWDETQEKYKNDAHRAAPQFAIPATAPNLERTGIIMEALSAEGHRSVIPEYYEIALKVRDTRDDESEKSIDILYEGLMYDIAEFYNISFSNLITELVLTKQSSDFVSHYEKNEANAQKALDKFVGEMLKE